MDQGMTGVQAVKAAENGILVGGTEALDRYRKNLPTEAKKHLVGYRE
jgi:hypothetical protein